MEQQPATTNEDGLIHVSESTMGTHQISAFSRCELAWHFKYQAKESPPRPDWALQGTLWHLAMAHEHAQHLPGAYLTAENAVKLQVHLDDLYAPFVPWVLDTLKMWRAKNPLEIGKRRVLAVEAELDVGETGATCGLDLMLEDEYGRAMFVDHKTVGRVVGTLARSYSRSSQFIAYNYIQSCMEEAGGVWAAVCPKSKSRAGDFLVLPSERFLHTEALYARQWAREVKRIEAARAATTPPVPSLSSACSGCEFNYACYL